MGLMSELLTSHKVTPELRLVYILISIGLVILAGLMSGLTLGLMSMDAVDLEVHGVYYSYHTVLSLSACLYWTFIAYPGGKSVHPCKKPTLYTALSFFT